MANGKKTDRPNKDRSPTPDKRETPRPSRKQDGDVIGNTPKPTEGFIPPDPPKKPPKKN